MWARYELKESAKNVLRRNYWMPFLASLIHGLIMGLLGRGSGSGAPKVTYHFRAENIENAELPRFVDEILTRIDLEQIIPFVGMGVAMAVVIGILALLAAYVVQFFAVGPLQIGYNRYYLVNRERDADLGELFGGFRKGYLNLAAAQFTTTLLISLLSLLIIPGIIFGYKWYQVPYILAENPHLSGRRAREISDAMTMGDKWEMFVLGLSFIGWALLGALVCGVGTLFVTPYIEATYAELYARQRAKVLAAGLATAEELPGV